MRYLTKEWCNLCQLTGLHFGLRAHKDVRVLNESVYQRLRKRKEKAFLKQEKEIYDFNPRELFDADGEVLVRADKFISGEEILEGDTIVNEMPEEQKEHIRKLIESYDSRGPFDIQKNSIEFENRQKMFLEDNEKKIPKDIYSQVADPRVFALGYSTKEMINQLKKISKENEKKVQSVLKDFKLAQEKENIPENIRERFGFHDCKVKSIIKKKDVTILLDTSGGFTEDNKIIFHDAKIIKEDTAVNGCWWIYEELYNTHNGYEAHMMFVDETNSYIELTIASKSIIVEKV
ncbi:DUF4085 family protein [Petrocella sp. FN5]|uniref:DUF4085 family protein n=1 Tax=Petrocella sp. FN5 TaxID=3032002 RepID=UPI0023DA01BD|nr:DUF4085 family protein [Petrocella sp. FN5]MDF1618315.1 DUF4085 family protein [Petrocella sp. FN5]